MRGSKTLYVAGRFDYIGGRASKIGKEIFESLEQDAEYHNGGYFKELKRLMEEVGKYNLIYWFADVPNDKPKLVKEIKKNNKACVLVTSKRNVDGRYAFQDLLYHALGIKSNLFVEFSKNGDKYNGRVADPLGNVFLDYNENFSLVGKVLSKRVHELLTYTRISSKKIGDKIDAPEEKEFFEIIRRYADVYHNLIHAHPEATNRFFGNASFRCERGFPSFKNDDLIFVSRRNIDKRAIDRDSFVVVKRELPVKYFGEYKPSVDTPIQISLYNHYPNIRYMLHSHTYIEDAPFTERIIPCGALEEAEEIIKIFPNSEGPSFSVNLRGHGSLVLADDVKQLKNIKYIARDVPEIFSDYIRI